MTDPFVDHQTNHIDIHLDSANCVADYSFPPTSLSNHGQIDVDVDVQDGEQRMEERKKRRERRLGDLERDRHRLPPFIVLPLPGPFKHVRPSLFPSTFHV